MSRPYDLAIFDFDGTLADSGGWFLGVLDEVADRYRFRRVAAAEHELLRNLDTAAICRHLGLPLWKLPFVARHMRKLAARDIGEIAPIPYAAQLITTLHRSGIRIAIVSSNARRNVETVLGPDLIPCIEIFACGASTFGKSAKFRGVLKRTRVDPARAISIGDEVRDIEAAKQAGIASGAVAWGYAAPAFLSASQPTHLFDKPDDILRCLLPT